uniref:Uncharacterized protein n=1 Tax=Siphoviridae sp. ctFH16 TaxID=2827817 RepID=A0A8S5TN72_9CAUD|nr:MAG TPA: hypothetical protein [Siphoviridae sp. ctFH16]
MTIRIPDQIGRSMPALSDNMKIYFLNTRE